MTTSDARAAVEAARAHKGPGWQRSLLLALLVGPSAEVAGGARRIFPLVMTCGGWSAYDGGLLRWAKERLLDTRGDAEGLR